MIFCIADLLPAADCAAVIEAAETAGFVDGRQTAGWHARQIKDNQQLAPAEPRAPALRARIAAALGHHELFSLVVRPKALMPVMISRYQPGMAYGAHVDDAIMGGLRSDVSFTIFLADPESYDGGELVIDTALGEQPFKLPIGAGVVYPSGALHRVAPVTRGTRLAAVGWAQSLVRDAARREILFDLDQARRSLFQAQGKTTEFDLVSKSVANLLRLWADT
ncbi:MAG: Fe2+-dependent dioxygenase [Candidatus Hydrogenedens sp.]|nr:Fe2+-dependent dioxygenase [Candidatus Hydrogenedens sp.]